MAVCNGCCIKGIEREMCVRACVCACVRAHVCFGEVMERGRGDKRNEKRVSARVG